jgi:hypothetical protein
MLWVLVWGLSRICVGNRLRSLARHAEFQLLIAVQAEYADGGAADSRLTDKMDSVSAEMIVPSLLAGVEERGDRIGFRIDVGEIGAFVQVVVDAVDAVDAGEAEVGFVTAATVFERADVLDVEGCEW